jgi:cytidylate kinase
VSSRDLFVAIEGLSGSGKTTIAKGLAVALGARYYKTPPVMFAPIREDVDRRASPLARHLYYYAGIAQASTEIGLLLRESGVVCDKYVATMLAYSRAGGVAVQSPAAGLILQPDVVVVLDVADEVRLRRISRRGRITTAHRRFLETERQLRVADEFRQPGVVTVNNSLPGVTSAIQTIIRHLRVRSGLSS